MPPVAAAQTLDEQYRLFLAGHCARLGFERDAENRLLPGQAGPTLAARCDGPFGPPAVMDPGPGAGISASVTGGGAGAAAGRSSLGVNDATLRDRREQAREEGDASPRSDTDIDVFRSGRAAAFLSLDRRYERQRVSQFESGRRAYSLAATFGADYRFGSAAIVGVALSRTDLSGDFAEGGDFDFNSRGTWIYGSWLVGERAFVDFSAGADVHDRDTRRLVGLTTVTTFPSRTFIEIDPPLTLAAGETRSRERAAELSGGLDFVVGSVTLGPRAGVVTRRMGIAAFVESGPTPMTLAFDRQTVRSERMSVGLQASRALPLQTGALIAQINLDWLHEFRDPQRLITARFAEDLRDDAARLSFLTQAPDRDWLNLRMSVVGVFSHRYSVFLSIEGTLGHSYLDRYGVSAGVRREF